MKSGINPFDSQEAKPYKNNPEILAMTNLVRYVCVTWTLLRLSCRQARINWHRQKPIHLSYFGSIMNEVFWQCELLRKVYHHYRHHHHWSFCVTTRYYYHFSAYQNNDINEFEKILRVNRQTIMEDPFIREHIEGGYNKWRYHLCNWRANAKWKSCVLFDLKQTSPW